MRIRTDGKFGYRNDTIDWAADYWDCNKTTALMKSADFTRAMDASLRAAMDHPDMTQELAETLSNRFISCEIQVNTSVNRQ